MNKKPNKVDYLDWRIITGLVVLTARDEDHAASMLRPDEATILPEDTKARALKIPQPRPGKNGRAMRVVYDNAVKPSPKRRFQMPDDEGDPLFLNADSIRKYPATTRARKLSPKDPEKDHRDKIDRDAADRGEDPGLEDDDGLVTN